MSIALQVYIQLIEAKDDKTRARVIADAFEAVEARLAQITTRTTQALSNEREFAVLNADSNAGLPPQDDSRSLDRKITEVEKR